MSIRLVFRAVRWTHLAHVVYFYLLIEVRSIKLKDRNDVLQSFGYIARLISTHCRLATGPLVTITILSAHWQGKLRHETYCCQLRLHSDYLMMSVNLNTITLHQQLLLK